MQRRRSVVLLAVPAVVFVLTAGVAVAAACTNPPTTSGSGHPVSTGSGRAVPPGQTVGQPGQTGSQSGSVSAGDQNPHQHDDHPSDSSSGGTSGEPSHRPTGPHGDGATPEAPPADTGAGAASAPGAVPQLPASASTPAASGPALAGAPEVPASPPVVAAPATATPVFASTPVAATPAAPIAATAAAAIAVPPTVAPAASAFDFATLPDLGTIGVLGTAPSPAHTLLTTPAARSLAALIALAAAIVLFLALHGLLDRRDPKLIASGTGRDFARFR